LIELRSKFIGSLFLVFIVWLLLFFIKSYRIDQAHLKRVETNITNAYISGKAISRSLSRYIQNKEIQDKPHLILKLIRNTLQNGLSPKEKHFISTIIYVGENQKITPIGISTPQGTFSFPLTLNEIEIQSTVKTNNLLSGKLTVVISLEGFIEEIRDLGYNITVNATPQHHLDFNISLNIKKRLLRLFNDSIYDHLLIILLLLGVYAFFQRGVLNALDVNTRKQNILLKEKEKIDEMYRQKEAVHNHIFQHYSSSIDQIKIYKELLASNDPSFSQSELVDKINKILDDLQSLKLSAPENEGSTLKECVERAVVSLYQKISQKEISVHTHFQGSDASLKKTHQNILSLLITNLLNQSIERLPKKGRIDIYLKADQKDFLTIKDEGYTLKLSDTKPPFAQGETLFSLDQDFLKIMAAANGLHLEFQLKNDTHIAQLGEVQGHRQVNLRQV